MEERGLTAFVCFHMDEHNSEYIAACDERIAFISGFTGSNGIVVVSKDTALMWTDSRYYIAAEKQLEEGFSMRKMARGEDMWFDWVAKNLTEGQKCGIDLSQYPATSFEMRSKSIGEKGVILEPTENLVDLVWGAERPARPVNPVKILADEFAGESSLDKQKRLAE